MNLILNFKVVYSEVITRKGNTHTQLIVSSFDELIPTKELTFNGGAIVHKGDLIYAEIADEKNEEFRNSEEGKKQLENKIIEACKALKTEETAIEIGVYNKNTYPKEFHQAIYNNNESIVGDITIAKTMASIIYQSADK